MTVLGLDGCRSGWVAVAIDGDGFVDAFIAKDVAEAESAGRERWNVSTIVVDIPIGLPDGGPRQADVEARAFIGPRRNSVFPTPVRAAVTAPTYPEAVAASVEACGKSLSKQAWAIAPKIREVDAFLRSGESATRILEGHPEVSFRAMANGVLEHYKKSLSGLLLRRELLAGEGIALREGIESNLPGCDLDDVHDAAAMAWTARRVERGEAWSLPDPPERFSDGMRSAIWC